MTRWQSLYLSSEQSESIISTIRSYFETHDYKIYHPLGALPGMSYPQTIKTFLAPPQADWSRLLIDGDNEPKQIECLAEHLSQQWDCLSVSLEGHIETVHGFRDGRLIDLVDWSKAHLVANSSLTIDTILNAESLDLPTLNTGQIGDVPIESLPDDIQEMARQVDAKQANKLFEKLSNRLLKAVGRSDARHLVHQGTNWDSQGGQTIRAVMACLNIPDSWRTPDFSTLRTAYTIQSRQAVSTLFPGDEESLEAVPNALDYQAIYGGKIR